MATPSAGATTPSETIGYDADAVIAGLAEQLTRRTVEVAKLESALMQAVAELRQSREAGGSNADDGASP